MSMADRDTISRVAKILARATSSTEPHEAAAALLGAYKRMVRDGVTLPDLLTLPVKELYQDALVKLIEVILNDQPSLSPPERREAYAEYMRLIVAKFSGEAGRSREDEAREYEARRKRAEAERHQAPPPESDEKPFSRQNAQTPEPPAATAFRVGRFVFSFSPATFFLVMRILFGRDSISWHAFHAPGRALRLFAASLLFGCAFAGVVLFLAGVLHAFASIGPLWNISLKNAFSFLAAIGFLWKARALFLSGWFR